MAEKVTLVLDGEEEVFGELYENERISSDKVKRKWHRYSLRHDDEGLAATLEPFVGVNHYGDFLTKKVVKFPTIEDRQRLIIGIERNESQD